MCKITVSPQVSYENLKQLNLNISSQKTDSGISQPENQAILAKDSDSLDIMSKAAQMVHSSSAPASVDLGLEEGGKPDKILKEVNVKPPAPSSSSSIKAGYDLDYKTKTDSPLGLTASKDDRLTALSRIAQVDDEGQTLDDNVRCGAAAVTAGALYAGGEKGMKTLVSAMQKFKEKNNVACAVDLMLEEVIQKMNSGLPLSKKDVCSIQDTLFFLLNQWESKDPERYPDLKNGLYNSALEFFVKDSPEIHKMFKDNKMTILNIDTDGDGKGNHFVLNLEHGAHKGNNIYDPWPRKNGQVISETAALKDYHAATISKISFS